MRNDELGFLGDLSRRLPGAPPGEVWIGDDAAVVRPPAGVLLLAADTLVEGVHADLALTTVADLGWKALAVNVSDIAAMGGRPLHALVTVTVPAGRGGDLDALYDGLHAASDTFGCPIVGGDLTSGATFVVTVAITGTCDGEPVLRSGAAPGDTLVVTGALGGAAADLRAGGAARHARPVPRVAEGVAAATGGATAMMDLSDGLGLDLRRLCAASAVGATIEGVPVAEGATEAEATGGGDDYELLIATADPDRLAAAFATAGLRAPIVIGRCTEGADVVGVPDAGWRHSW